MVDVLGRAPGNPLGELGERCTVKKKPASRRNHRKRAARCEERLAVWTGVQALLAVTKVILWLILDDQQSHR